jgi:hypothetical protein
MMAEQRNDEAVTIAWHEVGVNRIPGFWALTYQVSGGTVLRLRIHRDDSQQPETFIADVFTAGDHMFQELHRFSTCVYHLAHPDEVEEAIDWPPVWTNEFRALANLWERLTNLAEFGSTMIPGLECRDR